MRANLSIKKVWNELPPSQLIPWCVEAQVTSPILDCLVLKCCNVHRCQSKVGRVCGTPQHCTGSWHLFSIRLGPGVDVPDTEEWSSTWLCFHCGPWFPSNNQIRGLCHNGGGCLTSPPFRSGVFLASYFSCLSLIPSSIKEE